MSVLLVFGYLFRWYDNFIIVPLNLIVVVVLAYDLIVLCSSTMQLLACIILWTSCLQLLELDTLILWKWRICILCKRIMTFASFRISLIKKSLLWLRSKLSLDLYHTLILIFTLLIKLFVTFKSIPKIFRSNFFLFQYF